MRFAMQWLCVAVTVGLAAQSEPRPQKIRASAVWQLPATFMTTAHAVCDQSSQSSQGECMIGQMGKAGAQADAVRLSRELYKWSNGKFIVMVGFHDQGPVAFAWVTYPLRANMNYGLLLVNGQPRIIDVEDLKLLDVKTMKQTSAFRDLKAQYPNVDVWPGDPDGKIWPEAQVGHDGRIEFTVAHRLINGCHACAHAGRAIFTWNFDARRKFLGTSFRGMIDSPHQ